MVNEWGFSSPIGNDSERQTKEAVSVLGLGPMGQALADAFLKNGHPVTVWNRTPGKSDELTRQGAVLAESVTDAAAASELIIICVLDYNAVRSILSPAVEELKGRTVINLTADTPERAREMAGWASANGIDYVDGAIMTPTPTIGEATAVILYSGSEDVYLRHRQTLASLGGKASYLGSDPGRAAAYDITLLNLYWTAMNGYMHSLALARAENIAASDLAPYAHGIVEIMPAIMTQLAEEADRGVYPGDRSNIISAAASMEHITHVAEHHGLDSSILGAGLTVANKAIQAGFGEEGFSRLVEFHKR